MKTRVHQILFQDRLYRQSSSPMSRTILRYPRLMLMKWERGHLPGHGIILGSSG